MNNKSNKVNAAIIIIGNEILSGRTQDTNLAYISKWLNTHGVQVKEVRIIPDLEKEIINNVYILKKRCEKKIIEGGT